MLHNLNSPESLLSKREFKKEIFNSPKPIVYNQTNDKKANKQTTPQTTKESSRISDPTDEEKERMEKEWEKIKNMDTTELDRKYNLYINSTIYY